jgi:uncharacterized repeat protein (TIGR01451 family)
MRRRLYLILFVVLSSVCVLGWAVPSLWAVARSSADNGPAARGNDQVAPLAISKRAYPEPNVEGRTLFYDLTVRNNGPEDLTQVVITDTLPAGTRWANSASGYCRLSGNAALCSGLRVPANGTASVWFGVISNVGIPRIVNDQYGADAPLIAPVYGPPVVVPVVTPTPAPPYPGPTGTPEPSPTARPTQGAGVAPTPVGEPHLVLSQSIPSEFPSPGEEVVLRVAVTNDGSTGAHDVVVSLQMPAGLEVKGVVISPTAAYEWQGRVLWIAWGYVEAGTTAVAEVRAIVLPGAPGGAEVVVGVPDYGLEARAPMGDQPQLLPTTGLRATPWWGWALLAGGVVLGGVLLLKHVRRRAPTRLGE